MIMVLWIKLHKGSLLTESGRTVVLARTKRAVFPTRIVIAYTVANQCVHCQRTGICKLFSGLGRLFRNLHLYFK